MWIYYVAYGLVVAGALVAIGCIVFGELLDRDGRGGLP